MTGDVQGYCPMGCGRTLFLGEGGHVTCSWAMCPNPSAVELQRPYGTSVYIARPMFDVLLDDSQTCSCHLMRPELICNSGAMHIKADEYDRRDRIFL